MNGEWREEIPGFWVSKFPAGWQQNTITDNERTLSTTISNTSNTLVLSDENYTTTYKSTVALGNISTSTKMSLPVFTPLTYAYNCICIGDAFTLAKQVTKSTQSRNFYGLSSSVDSHMLKNSEWGAIAYLTHSQYGRDGAERNINNYYTQSNSYNRAGVTGVYANGTNISLSVTLGKPWYEETIGMLGSSTGNRTGVYDLNGCIYEQAAGYITNGDRNLNTYKGNTNWVKTEANEKGYETLSTEYFTIYPYNKTSDMVDENRIVYNGLKNANYGYGDAILETSIIVGGGSSNSWLYDHSGFACSSGPFFTRGRGCGNQSEAGVFALDGNAGSQNENVGFRVTVMP